MKNSNNSTFAICDTFTSTSKEANTSKEEFVPLMKMSNAATEKNKVQKIRTNITLVRKK